MEQIKFTPAEHAARLVGSWGVDRAMRYARNKETKANFESIAAHYKSVCEEIQRQADDRAERNARNAALLAAAPDMVDALRVVANCVGDERNGWTLGTYEMGVVRAAFAKVDGQSLRDRIIAGHPVMRGFDNRHED